MMNLFVASVLIFIVAVSMTMAGKGGGNFYVVILAMADVPMHQAATTGQFILFSTSLAAVIIFQRNKSVSWSLAVFIGTLTAGTALGGGYFSHLFSGFLLKLIFAGMLFMARAIMFFPAPFPNSFRWARDAFDWFWRRDGGRFRGVLSGTAHGTGLWSPDAYGRGNILCADLNDGVHGICRTCCPSRLQPTPGRSTGRHYDFRRITMREICPQNQTPAP